jgi:hypothetical protein
VAVFVGVDSQPRALVAGGQGIELGAQQATHVAEELVSAGLGDNMVHDSGRGKVSGADALRKVGC